MAPLTSIRDTCEPDGIPGTVMFRDTASESNANLSAEASIVNPVIITLVAASLDADFQWNDDHARLHVQPRDSMTGNTDFSCKPADTFGAVIAANDACLQSRRYNADLYSQPAAASTHRAPDSLAPHLIAALITFARISGSILFIHCEPMKGGFIYTITSSDAGRISFQSASSASAITITA